MLTKIGWYVLFLVALVIFFGLSVLLKNKHDRVFAHAKAGLFIVQQIALASGLIPIVAIPWILTGFFNLTYLLLIVAAFEVSILLSYVSSFLFRLTPKLVIMRRNLSLIEFRLKHPYLNSLWGLLALAILGSYIIIATYVYVSQPLHSDQAVRMILLLSLGLFLTLRVIVIIPGVAQIASPRIDDRIRAASFLNQISGTLQIGVMLTVYMGLAGIGVERFLPAAPVLPAGYLQYLPMVVVTALYLVLLVIPYFAGLERRRRAEISLNETILQQINKIIDVIGIPSEDDLDQLRQLRDEFVRDTNDWIESEPIIIDVAMKIDRPGAVGKVDPSLEALLPLRRGAVGKVDPSLVLLKAFRAFKKQDLDVLVESYRAFKDQDLLFVKLGWTDGMKAKLEEMIAEYNRYAVQPNRVRMFMKLGQAFGEYFKDQRQRYEGRVKAAEERKIVAPVLARLVPVLGAVPVVVQYGQRLLAILPLKQ